MAKIIMGKLRYRNRISWWLWLWFNVGLFAFVAWRLLLRC